MKSKVDFLIDEIVRRRPDLSREKVLEMAKKKIEEIGGISNYTAVLLIAIDLGVKLPLKPTLVTPIGKLVDSLDNVNVKGRVLWIKDEVRFKKRNGSTGVCVRVGLGDSTGTCTVVIWDRSREALEELGVVEGNVIEVLYASTRKSISGELEVHVGLRSEIQDRSEEIDTYPPINEFLTPLSQISEVTKRVNTFGKVIGEPMTLQYTRQDGELRELMRFNLTDGRVVRRVVVWSEVDKYSWIRSGVNVALFNVKPRIGVSGELELHVGKISHISQYSGDTGEIKYVTAQLRDLKQGYNIAKVYLRIDAVGKLRNSPKNRKTITLHGYDVSSDATITFIGEVAEKVSKVRVGDLISIAGMRVRFRGGEIYLFCEDSTLIEVNPRINQELLPPPLEVSFINLSEINVLHKVVNVSGRVVKEPVEEEVTQPFQTIRGEFFIEQNETPARVSYNGRISDYCDEELEVGDLIKIYGAIVETTLMIGGTMPYIPLRLRAFSKIAKVV